MPTREIIIPAELRPRDGRFGSGPSKVPQQAVAALSQRASEFMGTSHRQAPVRSLVASLRESLGALFDLPEGYEVVLGNGGPTLLWDALAFAFIEGRSHHYVFGEFSSKFAQAVASAPHLNDPEISEADAGTHPIAYPSQSVDVYALTHNETSTGVMMPVTRVSPGALIAVDATSAAGGLRVEPEDFDIYYFAPQKCFASDGGLWLALCSPAAFGRIETVAAAGRYIPSSLDLQAAVENSRKNQTYNTPALATLFLMLEQVQWMLSNGGLEWAASRCDSSAEIVYSWAESSKVAAPFVKAPEQRSHVVATIDFDPSVDAAAVAAVLRANGIVDTEPYRKLQRNQLRIALYPAIEPDDVGRLTRCIDYVIDALR